MVGEALLIFVGITAAIWFENGNDNRRERAVETEIIRSLMVDLQSDTTDLNGNVVALNLFLASADTVFGTLMPGRAWDSALARHFGLAYGVVMFMNSRAGYEHLLTEGLDVIQNTELRSQITNYYEFQARVTAAVEDRFVVRVRDQILQPHMIEKFTFDMDLAIETDFLIAAATPVDFEALKRDLGFRNALREYRGGLLMQAGVSRQQVGTAEALLAQMQAVLAER